MTMAEIRERIAEIREELEELVAEMEEQLADGGPRLVPEPSKCHLRLIRGGRA